MNQISIKSLFALTALVWCCPSYAGEEAKLQTGSRQPPPQLTASCPPAISCIEPDTACRQSQEVIATLKLLVEAYARQDLDTYRKYLHEECTTFDESTKELVAGKSDVLRKLDRSFAEHGPGSQAPLTSFTIDRPYARVDGDRAVVTFVAFKEIGGRHPKRMKSHITDVFVRQDGLWKKIHYRGRWQEL